MIGGRGGAGEGAGGGFGGGDEFGQSGPMERPRMGGSKAQIPSRDLDDEVPF
jgi:single-strand DNA-binding protein